MRRPRKSRSYYPRPRQRTPFATTVRRVLVRELRYFAKGVLGLGILVAVLWTAGLLSGKIDSVRWPSFATSRPTIQSLSTKDIVGRASVIDGDTFEIHGQRVRVWGVDAPESAQLCHIAGKPWRCGQQAALAVSDHIGQQTVACLERDRDRYGRIVAKCSVASQDIGVWLVSNGWALDYAQYSGGDYSSHQTSAATAKLGIWKGEFDKPWEWRRTKR